MRRPTRTRRLSIAAIISLLASVAVAGAGVRSLYFSDEWHFGSWRRIALANGCIEYSHWSGSAVPLIKGPPVTGHKSIKTTPGNVSLGFGMYEHDFITNIPRATETVFVLWTSLWLPFFLLLITPVRWVFSRPGGAALSVMTDTQQKCALDIVSPTLDQKATLDYGTAKPGERTWLSDVGCILLWALFAAISLTYLNDRPTVEAGTVILLAWIVAICIAVIFHKLTRARDH